MQHPITDVRYNDRVRVKANTIIGFVGDKVSELQEPAEGYIIGSRQVVWTPGDNLTVIYTVELFDGRLVTCMNHALELIDG